MSTEAAEIRRLASEVIAEQFEGVDIVSVTMEETEDEAGDGILAFRIVFDSRTDKLDPKRVAGLIRHLRSRLHDVAEERFPVVAFVSKAEAAAEAA
ncbi:hypothetical protein [Amaricoccus sp.]|uniref:hypothetical protein n=1 Tax=Amaricoccus sp. TaxID=1872485 RepID=UPI001B78227C|nr:hypothetical protein [Amaricoccus sp.]MBP7001427.1 hypothetical protein [Amaricoccus sp.]